MRLTQVTGWLIGVLLCLTSLSCGSSGISLQGAGATFPAPLYKRWFLEYYRQHPDVRVNYQAIGSGAGIRQFTENVVKFGASDAFMSKEEIEKAKAGGRDPLLLPMTAGSIVLCYNIPGVPEGLRLSRKVYVDIFLGEIESWDDKAIAAINPNLSLPSLKITVVRRSESSGTTFVFTNHLSAISEKWREKKGKPAKNIPDPPLTSVAAKGNSGVTALITQTPGAIGYLEYGYAILAHLPSLPDKPLPMALLENKSGAYIEPTPENGREALSGPALAHLPDDLHIEIPDPEGSTAYPIVTYTWLICDRSYEDERIAQTLKDVVRYCLTDGQKLSGELGYIPLPEEVSKRGLQALEQIHAR
jgi:phosphate transport system substrate-binding protein